MTRAQENRFKRALEAKRSDLIRELGEGRERLAIDPASDPMDQVCSTADRDLAVHSVDRMHAVLRLVEGALSEIRDGTFGVCAQCGDDIPVKRLEAVPWSPYCVTCQERAEQSGCNGELAEDETPYALAS
jgi:DnaK suppressor protein